MANELKGRTALVTGGSRGIGAAVCRALAEAGAAVAINCRERIGQAEQLAAEGKHLVVVRYGPEHSEHQEWVYNGADLDGAAVVWARDLGPEWYPQLRAAFPGRHYWLLYADETPARLEPLP